MEGLVVFILGLSLFLVAGLLVDLWTKRQEKLGR
jgi:hypothetical protein